LTHFFPPALQKAGFFFAPPGKSLHICIVSLNTCHNERERTDSKKEAPKQQVQKPARIGIRFQQTIDKNYLHKLGGDEKIIRYICIPHQKETFMAHYLDPKNDLVFKRIFGEHPKLLISFLNALMPLEAGRVIESIEYLPPELVPENPALKNSVVDVRCKDNYERQFVVEIQMYWSSAFTRRMVFNVSKAYVRQIDKGKGYELLQPVYGLAILNDYIPPKNEKTGFYHHYRIVNRGNTDEVIKGLEFVLVELPKFRADTWSDRKMAALWLRFLREVEENTSPLSEELLSNAEIRQAVDLCEEGAYTPEELAAYEKYWDIVRTEIATNKASRDEGKAEGIAEGRAEGERENTIKVVKNSFYQASLSVETISAITGLTPEEVNAILKQ
jgi:predicted transposase/invertase (TIGR01784 family)